MTKVIRLTHETLRELLDYDPATGVFVWKVARSNRVKVGSRAGVFHKTSGGRYISIANEKFMAHRLAWFYVHGEWPASEVRPIDGNYDHCAISNLKEVSRQELAHARGKQVTNTSGFNGVSRAKNGKWQAKITWNYKQISLGANFDSAKEAGSVYEMASTVLKTATSENEIKAISEALRLEKRQRAAWNNLMAVGIPVGWASFGDFVADVRDVPARRFAMGPIDPTKIVGPGNYRWASSDHEILSSKDRVAYNRANREANRDHHRGRDFQKKYGIDFGQYQQMLIAQKGVCAVCEQPETKMQHGSIRMLSVDHNHATGAVRGLLCANCNMAIGYACDDVSVLQKAIGYLRRHDPSNVVPFEPSIVNGTLGNGV